MSFNGAWGGFSHALVWRLDSQGYPTGAVPALANGEMSGAIVLNDVDTGTLNYVDPVDLDIRGGDDPRRYSFQFANSRLGSFDLTMANFDADFTALLNDSKVEDEENTFFPMVSPNSGRVVLPPVGLALFGRWQDREAGSDGAERFGSIVIPRVQMSTRLTGFSFQSAAPTTFRVAPRDTSRFMTGQLFGNASNQLDLDLFEDKTDHVVVVTDYPWHLVAYRGDDEDTGLTLPYRPVSSVVTVNASPNWQTINGVTTALSSANVSTGAITFATPTDADKRTIIYQTAYRPSPA